MTNNMNELYKEVGRLSATLDSVKDTQERTLTLVESIDSRIVALEKKEVARTAKITALSAAASAMISIAFAAWNSVSQMWKGV